MEIHVLCIELVIKTYHMAKDDMRYFMAEHNPQLVIVSAHVEHAGKHKDISTLNQKGKKFSCIVCTTN